MGLCNGLLDFLLEISFSQKVSESAQSLMSLVSLMSLTTLAGFIQSHCDFADIGETDFWLAAGFEFET
jgi:hypothetical protein